MKVTQSIVDSLHGIIKIEVAKADYAERVDSVLKDYRRKAVFDGVRKGKTPMEIIKKMYGKSVLLEELNKLLARGLTDFIRENNIPVMGDPLLHKEQQGLDFSEENHVFLYDVAYLPAVNVQLDKRTRIPFYTIKIDDELIDKEIAAIARSNGKMVNVEVSGASDYLAGDLVELDAGGEEKEGGIRGNGVSILLDRVKDDQVREELAGKRVGSRVVFNLARAFPNKTDLSAMLGVDKDRVETLASDVAFTINEIKRHVASELDQELFNKLYGSGVVNSIEEFRERVRGEIARQFRDHRDYRFTVDAREKMFEKNEGVALPEDFLKRWLVETNKQETAEHVEKHFDAYREKFTWELVKNALVNESHVEVTEEDLHEVAIDIAISQLQRYGLYNISVEELQSFAKRLLENEQQLEIIRDRALENKLFAYIKERVKLDDQEVSLEDFWNLFKNKK